MKTQNKTLLLISLVITALVLVYIFVAPKNATAPVVENKQEVKETYTYINHGFSIELPKGFVPQEEKSKDTPSYTINMPDGHMSYVTDAAFWEPIQSSQSEYVEDKKIGETTFKVYDYEGIKSYWYRKGNVGYLFTIKNTDRLKTFKFIGWPQIEGNTDDLVSFSIKPGQEVSGKIKITGTLKGAYFFEGNLPISILDSSKKVTGYGPGHADATTDWMTSGPVSFAADFDFTMIPKGLYYIKLTQDDPRDESEKAGYKVKEILIPININNKIYGDSIDDPDILEALDNASVPTPALEDILGYDGTPLAIRTTGTITAMDNGCWVDGTCLIQIDKKTWIIYSQGRTLDPKPVGTVEGDLKIGAKVSVYAQLTHTQTRYKNSYTIIGGKEFYIKVVK